MRREGGGGSWWRGEERRLGIGGLDFARIGGGSKGDLAGHGRAVAGISCGRQFDGGMLDFWFDLCFAMLMPDSCCGHSNAGTWGRSDSFELCAHQMAINRS